LGKQRSQVLSGSRNAPLDQLLGAEQVKESAAAASGQGLVEMGWAAEVTVEAGGDGIGFLGLAG
jgi:hypothetical protein